MEKLTVQQKNILRWMVARIRDGTMPENFECRSHGRDTFLLHSGTTQPIKIGAITVPILEALRRAKLLKIPHTTKFGGVLVHYCSVLNSAFEAVDTDFRQDVSAKETIFLAHANDHPLKETTTGILEKLGLSVIVIQEEPKRGKTIIDKYEDFAGYADCAVVLLTADDRGGPAVCEPMVLHRRARQNVIFEMGYLAARLGRKRVIAVLESGVEIPSEFSGVEYIMVDDLGMWRYKLAKELEGAGLTVDPNRLQ